MSHAAGVANSIAWQFHPRGTHRVGLFSLDFLWFFLVSKQERTDMSLFAMLFCCDATHHPCSLEKALRASPKILNPTIPGVKTLGSVDLPYGAGNVELNIESRFAIQTPKP